MDVRLVYMTAGSRDEARTVGQALLESNLAACVNIIDNMNSLYMWQGAVQDDQEVVVIAARDISVIYPGGVRALTDVSLDCSPGTLTGIVGPNGSGMTTLIKALAGLIDPSGGNVMVDGEMLSSIPLKERARRIAHVPQDTHIPFPFTALEVVLMGRAPHLTSFAFEGADDVAEAHRAMVDTETSAFTNRCIHELSGGERQRVILA